MKKRYWLFLLAGLLLSACQSAKARITIVDGEHIYSLETAERLPARLLADAKVSLGSDDRIIYLGSSVSPNTPLPSAGSYTLTIRRAVTVTIDTPGGAKSVRTSARSVGEALQEAGFSLHASDRIDPPAGVPLTGPLTIEYEPATELVVSVDGAQVKVRSAASSVGQALTDAGLPLVGLDYSRPDASAPIPVDGQIRVVRAMESVTLTEKSIPFGVRTEPSADLELDQQALIQGGQAGLAIVRMRTRTEDGQQVSQKTEGESQVRPPQDRILGYGTKVVIRTTVVDGLTIQYYRALRLMTTSYSPCRSASPDGRCLYGTSSGLPVQQGTVAMVYSWYLAFGFDRLYIPGYGYATVGDVGAGCPPAAACPNIHYWVDLAWTDAAYQPMAGWTTVYFLTPVPQNLVYILP